mgnify:FL=1
MKNLFNILFCLFGICLPIIVIVVSLVKSNFKINKNVIDKFLIAVIIFLIFYIVKVGGIKLVNNMSNNKDVKVGNTVKKNNSSTTSTTTTSTSTTTTSSTTTTTTTTTKKKQDVSVSSNTEGLKIIDGILIVNKSYPLPKDYVPTNTYKDATGLNYCSECINVDAYEEYKLMKADMASLGLNIWIQSGYRSYNLQESLYNKYVNRDGKLAADTYSARPGYSEHQTGLAFDLNSISDDFQYTSEGKWVNENAWRYGFILRYPKSKESITGYKYESWHLRYVGKDLASKLYNNGDWITLEEHFNLTSKYAD